MLSLFVAAFVMGSAAAAPATAAAPLLSARHRRGPSVRSDADSSCTLYKVSSDQCGQSTLDCRFSSYAITFAGLSSGTCADQGFTVADGSQTLHVPVIGNVTVEMFKKPSSGRDFSAKSDADSSCTLYKVSNDECGQSTLDCRFSSYASKFAGLSSGTCTDQGFTVADGSQTLHVPVIGNVTVEMFKKPSSGRDFSAKSEADSSCTLYKVSSDQCGQSTLDCRFSGYAIKFAGLSSGTCADQGFTVADGSQTLHVPVIGNVTVEMFKKPSSGRDFAAKSDADSSCTLYKVSSDECGQSTLDCRFSSYAITFAGLTSGTCADEGFTVADGSQTLHVPVIGNVTVEMFKKPSSGSDFVAKLDAGSSCTLYKVSSDECGQSTLDCRFSSYASKFAGLSSGTCADQGFTVAGGSRTLHVPVIGNVTVELFRKPSAGGAAAKSDHGDGYSAAAAALLAAEAGVDRAALVEGLRTRLEGSPSREALLQPFERRGLIGGAGPGESAAPLLLERALDQTGANMSIAALAPLLASESGMPPKSKCDLKCVAVGIASYWALAGVCIEGTKQLPLKVALACIQEACPAAVAAITARCLKPCNSSSSTAAAPIGAAAGGGERAPAVGAGALVV